MPLFVHQPKPNKRSQRLQSSAPAMSLSTPLVLAIDFCSLLCVCECRVSWKQTVSTRCYVLASASM